MRRVWTTLAVSVALATALAFAVGRTSRGSGPELIRYGRDTCARCRMHFSTPGYAGELRDRQGRVTKYDDIGCMLLAMWSAHAETPEAWVEDHETGAFLPLLTATLVRGSGMGTPMGYGVVAFQREAAAQQFAQANSARVATLEELLKDQSLFVTRTTLNGGTAQ